MRFIITFLMCICLFISSASIFAAEYNGKDIDGERFDATAYSYKTHKFYNVTVEFDGDEVTIYFYRGGHIIIDMDDEEIDDPHNISCYDYKKREFWDIDVDDLD